jgi:hypothetical protein
VRIESLADRVSLHESVPRLAHRPSVPLRCARHPSCHRVSTRVAQGPLSFQRRRRVLFGLLGLVSADVRACCAKHPNRFWLGSPECLSHIRPPPVKLDVTPLAVAGLRPATNQLDQGTSPHTMVPGPALAEPRLRSKSVHEMHLDEPQMIRPCRPAVSGPPSSLRADLTGILLALEEPEGSIDATILTDFLVSIQWMIAAQHLDWQL